MLLLSMTGLCTHELNRHGYLSRTAVVTCLTPVVTCLTPVIVTQLWLPVTTPVVTCLNTSGYLSHTCGYRHNTCDWLPVSCKWLPVTTPVTQLWLLAQDQVIKTS